MQLPDRSDSGPPIVVSSPTMEVEYSSHVLSHLSLRLCGSTMMSLVQ